MVHYSGLEEEIAMVSATASEVRNNFKSYLDMVNEDSEELLIIRERGANAVLISEDDWRSIQETLLIYEDVKVLDSMRRSLKQMEDGDVMEFASPRSLRARRGK
jgi:antitoxin YefM